MNRLFKSKRELIRKINILEKEKDNLLKANKKLLHNSNVVEIKNFNLKQEINKLQNGALDKNIIAVDESVNDMEIIKLTVGTVRNLTGQIKSLQKQVNYLVDEKVDLTDEINKLKQSTEYQHFVDGSGK